MVVDTREQTPWNLEPLQVGRGTLPTGDYSLLDFPEAISIERKELSDFIGVIGHGRERFERELMRLKAYEASMVIVEASWQDLEAGDWRSKIKPNVVLQSIASWVSQGHNIILAGDREMGERIARSALFFAYRRKIEPVKRILKEQLKQKKK
ncbi:ERCC4 domain-containing protein [bacterium]|nr:ERCC4 domain-containing protein [bacterium]